MHSLRALARVFASSAALAGALGCQTSSTPSTQPDASVTPSEDGAACGCQTPDCIPSCSDLPICKRVCVGGSVVDWIDSCGIVQYANACDAGCADAAVAVCQ